MPFITPDEISTSESLISFCVPDSFVHIIRGLIVELTHDENWEQYDLTALTVEQCTAVFSSVLDSFEVSDCV